MKRFSTMFILTGILSVSSLALAQESSEDSGLISRYGVAAVFQF